MTLKKEITEQIRDLLRQNPNGLSITAITRQIGINRNTAGRYLENLMVSGQVEMRHFGMAKIYRLAQRVPLSAMLSIASELIMLLDSSSRVIYANEPMLAFLSTTQKDLYGRNIEFTACITAFDDAFDTLKKRTKGAIDGKEWAGEIAVKNGTMIFACRIAPAVFEEGQRGASILLEDVTIRRKAEEAIRTSELEFRMLAENTFDIIDRHTPDGLCLYISPAIQNVSGFEPAEIIGHDGAEFIHPNDAAGIGRLCNHMTPDRPSATVAYRCRHKDGHYIWVESSFRAMFDERTGQMTEIYGVTRDITARIAAEEALRESEDRYRTLVEISPDAILLHQEGRIVYLNPAAMRLIGASSPEDIIGKNVLDIVDPHFRERVRLFIRKDLDGDLTPLVELLLIRPDGTTVPVEGRGVRTLVGGSPAVQVTLRDITERKNAERSLRASEERYRSLAEASRDLIFVIDRNDTVEYVNSHAAGILGMSAEEITGKIRADLFPGERGKPQADRLQEVFRTGKSVRSEGAIMAGRKVHWFDHFLLPVVSQHGEVTSVLGISRDITDRKCIEESLKKSEERLRDIIEHSTNLFYSHDTENRFTYMSPQFESILGYRENPAGLFWTDITTDTPENRTCFELTKRAIATRIRQPPYEVEVFSKDGRRIWLEINEAPVIRDGKTVAIVGAAQDITEKKLALQALSRSEERFHDLITTTPDIVWETDAEARFVYISPQVEQILGYHMEDLIGHTPFEFLDSSGIAENREAFAAVIRKKEHFIAYNSHWAHKDGHRVILETRARPVYRDDGSFAGFRGIDRDVTGRVHAEEALYQSERRFHDLAELLPQNVWECDITGKLTFANQSSFDMYGYTPDDFEKGLYAWQMIHPDDRQRVMDDFLKALNHTPAEFPDHHEYTALRKDGGTFPVIMYHVPIIQDNTIAGMRGIGIDLTERKQMEEALREVVRAYRMLAENSVDIISRIRPDGTCLYISPAVRWCLGYEPEEVAGRPGSEFIHPDDIPHVLEMIRFFETNGSDTGTDRFRMRHKDGSYVWFEATIRVTRDEETGSVKEFTLVSRSAGKYENP